MKNENKRYESIKKDIKAGGRKSSMPRPTIMHSKKEYSRQKFKKEIKNLEY